MAKKDIINGLRMEIGKLDRSIQDVDKERHDLLEERMTYVRMINFLTGENMTEIPINAYAGGGQEGKSRDKGKYVAPVHIGQEPTEGTKKFHILEALRKMGEMTVKQISDLLDMDPSPVSGQLSMLVAQKLVIRVSTGLYKAASATDIEAAIAADRNGNGHHLPSFERSQQAVAVG